MQKLKNLVFLFSVMLLVLGSSISSYAITDYDSSVTYRFSDGPFSNQRASFTGVGSNDEFVRYSIPSYGSDGYYKVTFNNPSYDYLDGYVFSTDGNFRNIVVASSAPLVELYTVDWTGVVIANVLDDALLCEKGGYYFYGVTCSGGPGVAFRATETVLVTELSSEFGPDGLYHDYIVNAMPYMAIYDGLSISVQYPGMVYGSYVSGRSATYGYGYHYFPVVVSSYGGAGSTTFWKFYSRDGVLNSDSEYSFVFDVYNVDGGRIYIGDSSDYVDATVVDNTFTATIQGQDTSLSNLGFGFHRNSSGPSGICFVYQSSKSDDIGTVPPDDSGGDSGSSGSPDYSSALSGIGSTLKSLMQNVSSGTTTIVNNITNQTTQISNTISNVSNQITNTLQNVQQGLENKLQGVEEGISNTIEQSNQELIQNDQKLHSEKLEADKENTQAVTDAVEEHGNFIIEGLKGLFIPSDEFFKTYFDDLYEFFNDKFGFLSFPIDLLVRLVDLFVNSSDKDCILTLPEFEISGEKLIKEASFNLTEFLENDFGILLSSIRLVTSIGLIMAFVNLCQDKWNEVMRN